MNTTRKKAMDWLDNQIELRNILNEKLSVDITVGRSNIRAIDIRTPSTKEIHVSGIIALADALKYPYIKRIWPGNEQCDTNYNEIYIYYKGYKVFELKDR